MPIKPRDFDLDNLAQRYLAGEGLEGLAIEVGVSPQSVGRRLRREAGVRLRNRSEAMKVRMQRTGVDGRRKITEAAHAAVRGRKWSPAMTMKMHTARARALSMTTFQVGRFESDLDILLRDRGLNPVPQEPIGTYNIDLSLPPIAVEVHVGANNPTSDKHHRKRIKYLIESSRIPVYVWITKAHPLGKGAANKIVSLYHAAKWNPASVGQCRVIWGTGEDAIVRCYGDEFSPIPPTEPTEYVGRVHRNIARETT